MDDVVELRVARRGALRGGAAQHIRAEARAAAGQVMPQSDAPCGAPVHITTAVSQQGFPQRSICWSGFVTFKSMCLHGRSS